MYDCAICAIRKNLKPSSEGGDCGSKKCRRSYNWVWRGLESGGTFLLVRLAGIYLASVALKIFSHLICFIQKCYTLNAICKGKAAVKCYCSAQNRLIPFSFDGVYYARNNCNNQGCVAFTVMNTVMFRGAVVGYFKVSHFS